MYGHRSWAELQTPKLFNSVLFNSFSVGSDFVFVLLFSFCIEFIWINTIVWILIEPLAATRNRTILTVEFICRLLLVICIFTQP